MITEGICKGAIIESSKRIGDENSKTDVLIKLKESEDLKISAKLLNADFFGNWYGHERMINEFGLETFEKLTEYTTKWANDWLKTSKDIFVGVSISFGSRTGDTGEKFTDIFKVDDVLKIVKGVGTGEDIANTLYIGDKCPDSIERLISYLKEISVCSIKDSVENFKVIYRPVYPKNSGSDRGKCVYTRFQPFKRLEKRTIISSIEEFRKLGEFVPVDYSVSYKINHNKVLDILRDCYNIEIVRKGK